MAKQRSPNNSVQRKRRSLVLFIIAAILAFAYFALLALPELKLSWLPAWPWLSSAKVILVALAAAIAMLGALYSNVFLRLAERTESSRPPGVKQLRDESPLLPVTYDTLIKGLGNGGEIPWIKRGMASSSLLNEHDRIAVIGPMKSGKTREAIELIRIAVQNGLVSTVFQPAGAINVIDPELLASAVAVQLDRPCLFFIDDIGAIQDEAYLDRLSTCIDTIARHRPDARFVVTLQVERLQLSEILQAWVEKHRFHRISPPDLTAEQRRELAKSATETLKASLTPEAVAVLGNDVEIVRPWDIVWVLQAALDRKAGRLTLTEGDVKALLAEGEQAVWARQRQALITAEPATGQLLEGIGTFFSAGATPRESSILRYAAYRMPDAMRPNQKRLHLRRAADHLQQYAIVATDGLFAIPEPRLLPLIIDASRAREQLNAFLAAYNPGFWTSLAVRVLRPFDFLFKPWHRTSSRSAMALRARAIVQGLSRRVFSFLGRRRTLQNLEKLVIRLLEPVFAWPGDRALLAAELGSPRSFPSLLSSAVVTERGRLALLSGSFRTALDQLSMAVALNPKNVAALTLRGETYRQLGEYARAMADIDQAIARAPKFASAIASRGMIYLQQGEHALALADLDQAITLDPKNAAFIAGRGMVYLLQGEYALALADFDQAIALDPKNAAFIFNRGLVYLQQGEHARALADFNQAVTLDPKNAELITRRGLVYLQQGEHARALADFGSIIELAPKNTLFIACRGLAYLQQGKCDMALADFDRAISLDERLDWVLASRGDIYQFLGKYDQALADYDRAIALDPDNASTIAGRGDTFRLVGKYDQALADYDRAIALDENNASMIANRGATHQLIKEHALALADFDRAIALDEKYSWPIALRGETYRLMGQYDLALTDFDRVIELESCDWYLYERALTYRVAGREEAAVADLTAALAGAQAGEAKNPEDWMNRLNLALYHLALGDLVVAKGRYQAAIHAGVSQHIAHLAVQDLDDYLCLFPADEAAHEIRERLQQYVEERFQKEDKIDQ